jgi:hypothetical protein
LETLQDVQTFKYDGQTSTSEGYDTRVPLTQSRAEL